MQFMQFCEKKNRQINFIKMHVDSMWMKDNSQCENVYKCTYKNILQNFTYALNVSVFKN